MHAAHGAREELWLEQLPIYRAARLLSTFLSHRRQQRLGTPGGQARGCRFAAQQQARKRLASSKQGADQRGRGDLPEFDDQKPLTDNISVYRFCGLKVRFHLITSCQTSISVRARLKIRTVASREPQGYAGLTSALEAMTVGCKPTIQFQLFAVLIQITSPLDVFT